MVIRPESRESADPGAGAVGDIKLDVVRGLCGPNASFGRCELGIRQRQGVVLSWIELFMLIDPVEDIDEFLEEDTGHHPDLASQVAGDRIGQGLDVGIVCGPVPASSGRRTSCRSRTLPAPP